MAKLTVSDVDLTGKTVLVRVDFNVTFHPGTNQIADDSRIDATLPTLQLLLSQDCKLVLCSHLGRPQGKVVDNLRMAPVSQRLSEKLSADVLQMSDSIGPEVSSNVKAMNPRDIIMLENLRFHPEEEVNDPTFSESLASLAEVYVNDAFGAAHRAHASTEGVAHHLDAVSGLLMAKELTMLGRVLESPKRPLAAIFGGAKVSDKLLILRNLMTKADIILVGGGMAATFLRAKGFNTGNSLVEEDLIGPAREVINSAQSLGVDLLLPTDFIVSNAFAKDADHCNVSASSIPSGWQVMDIGQMTVKSYSAALQPAQTILWNGTQGVFEWSSFANGTKSIANTVATRTKAGATTLIGGGSTAEAIYQMGLAGQMTHVSTGGGASLEFLEGKPLPGVAVLLE